MRHRIRIFTALLAILGSTCIWAQDPTALARELIQAKGGYVEKKRLLEEMRLRAYIPLMLKAVGKGAEWNPRHPNWRTVENRITEDWFRLNADHQRSLGRDPSYDWFDDTLAREYASAFSADELRELIAFYRAPAGVLVLRLELALLAFYPASMVSALAMAMVANETLSGRQQELFRSPQSRARRDFVALFETETIIRQESVRVGGPYVEASYPAIQQGALAIAARRIDALRGRLPVAERETIAAFLAAEAGSKERMFLARVMPVVLPAPEDPVLAAVQETEFFKKLEKLTAQWRQLAASQ